MACVSDELLLLLDVIFDRAYCLLGEDNYKYEYEDKACKGDLNGEETKGPCELELAAGVEEDSLRPIF